MNILTHVRYIPKWYASLPTLACFHDHHQYQTITSSMYCNSPLPLGYPKIFIVSALMET
jgi:hypothetical protein